MPRVRSGKQKVVAVARMDSSVSRKTFALLFRSLFEESFLVAQPTGLCCPPTRRDRVAVAVRANGDGLGWLSAVPVGGVPVERGRDIALRCPRRVQRRNC